MKVRAMTRRLPALAIALAALIGAGLAARSTQPVESAVFGTFPEPWMPHATGTVGITDSWFCPGVPATGVDGVEGLIRIANRSDEVLPGTVLLYNDRAENRRVDIEIAPYSESIVDLDDQLPGTFTGAVVEVEGGGALVEQESTHPEGNSLSPCSNSTGTEWYLADGYTVDGSLNHILLSNPFEEAAVARLEFSTESLSRGSDNFSNLAIPARSIVAIDMGAPGAGAQGEPLLAVSVSVTRGQIVAGRAQQFKGEQRSGTQVGLGVPILADQWRFSGSNFSEDSSEQYSIYNPTDSMVSVDPIVVGFTPEIAVSEVIDPISINPIEVPAHSVVAFDPAEIKDFPAGDYAIIFSSLGQDSVVVERATTRTVGDETQTTVIPGSFSQPETGYIATQWHIPAGPAEPTEAALVIHNVDQQEGTITVYAFGSAGAVPVPSLTDIVLPSATKVLKVDLTDEAVLGRELIVQATNRIVVERWYPSGSGDTRTAAWAFPADVRADAETQ